MYIQFEQLSMSYSIFDLDLLLLSMYHSLTNWCKKSAAICVTCDYFV